MHLLTRHGGYALLINLTKKKCIFRYDMASLKYPEVENSVGDVLHYRKMKRIVNEAQVHSESTPTEM